MILYTTPNGDVKMEVFLQNETLWLTQKMIAELYEVEINTINYHLKEIFKSGELEERTVIRKIRITASDGKDYLTAFYNLDAIIAVGYRVNSRRATQFRIWATAVRQVMDYSQSQSLVSSNFDKYKLFKDEVLVSYQGKANQPTAWGGG